jgi:hypothetical protein
MIERARRATEVIMEESELRHRQMMDVLMLSVMGNHATRIPFT